MREQIGREHAAEQRASTLLISRFFRSGRAPLSGHDVNGTNGHCTAGVRADDKRFRCNAYFLRDAKVPLAKTHTVSTLSRWCRLCSRVYRKLLSPRDYRNYSFEIFVSLFCLVCYTKKRKLTKLLIVCYQIDNKQYK